MLTWFEVIGYTVLLEPDIASGRHQAERSNQTEVVLLERLRSALENINPHIPAEAIATAIDRVTCLQSPSLLENNHRFHQLLTEGVDVEYVVDNRMVRDKVWLCDRSNLLNNDWLAIHQFPVTEGENQHSPDLVVFINGLPLAVIEWIYPRDGTATLNTAYQQLQTYTKDIPTLFSYNEILVISDGNQARVGTLTSDLKQFIPWHTIDGEDLPIDGISELEVLIQGIFDKRRFLDIIKHFIEFKTNRGTITKKLTCRPFCTIKSPKQTSIRKLRACGYTNQIQLRVLINSLRRQALFM